MSRTELAGRILVAASLGLVGLAACGEAGSEGDGLASNPIERAREERAAGAPISFASGTGPKAVALLIAISDYGAPPETMKNARGQSVLGYRPLNAANDVPFVRGALERQGFRPENVALLTDSAATREGILSSLEALVNGVGAGDVVVVHYSGHGHQLTDEDGLLDELDGYDEVLVPFGAPAEFPVGYLGELHIRDDTLGYYVERLRERAGPTGSVAVFLDACYSGTGTRSGAGLPARGGLPPLGPPHAQAAEAAAAPGTRGASGGGGTASRETGSGFASDLPRSPREPSAGAGSGGVTSGGAGRGGAGLAPLVVITAAAHDEMAFETLAADGKTPVGSLTYALTQGIPRLRPGDSYDTLFRYVLSALNGRVKQTPQMEGDRNAVALGTGFVREAPPLGRVLGVLPDGRVELAEGGLMGLNVASVVAFLPPGGDAATAQPWTRGTVSEASMTRAIVTLEAPFPSGSNPLEARVIPERLAYGERAIRVAVDPSLPAALRDSIEGRLRGSGMVTLVPPDEGADVRVGVDAVEGHLADGERRSDLLAYRSRQAAASLVDAAPLSPAGASAAILGRRVEEWARNQYLRSLQLDHPSIEVDLELAVVEYLSGDRCTDPDWESAAAHPGNEGGGRWTLPPETDYVLGVRNRGALPLHFAVIDLMPAGDTVALVKPLFPEPGQSAEATILPPGERLRIPASCFYTEPLAGIETLKLFVSTDPIPVDQLVGMRTRSGGGSGQVPMTATREIHLRIPPRETP